MKGYAGSIEICFRRHLGKRKECILDAEHSVGRIGCIDFGAGRARSIQEFTRIQICLSDAVRTGTDD